MKKLYFLLLLATTVLFSSCEKASISGKLVGTWDAAYYKIDGVDQDISGQIVLYFSESGNGNGTFKNYIETQGGAGFENASFFKHIYLPKNNRLILFYDTGLKEEFKISKMKALPGWLSYSSEEEAKEEYMILTKGNEELKFVKRWEE
jgi:hypothetical protein